MHTALFFDFPIFVTCGSGLAGLFCSQLADKFHGSLCAFDQAPSVSGASCDPESGPSF